MDLSIKAINKQIDEFKKNGDAPKTLVIGYKTYARLMADDKFSDKVTKDSKEPLIRYYKNIKLKIVTEKNYFEVR